MYHYQCVLCNYNSLRQVTRWLPHPAAVVGKVLKLKITPACSCSSSACSCSSSNEEKPESTVEEWVVMSVGKKVASIDAALDIVLPKKGKK